MEYILKSFSSKEELKNSSLYKLSSYHWEEETPYRPNTYANIGIVGESLVTFLKCYEENPKTDCSNRDDPVYTDSCLEFFCAPVGGRAEYINVECNSRGVFLTEFGRGKYDRVLVSTITEFSPIVEPFFGSDVNGAFWGVFIELTKKFLSDLYDTDINFIDFNSVKLNFYKCGDGCKIKHYLAFSPVTDLPPGFHNPECFATFEREM